MKRIKYLVLSLIAGSMMTACHSDLDQTPIDPDLFTEVDVYQNVDEAKSALAKVYASLALTGQQGPAGQPDISGFDEGSFGFTRMLFNMNELTTDHLVNAWSDPALPGLQLMTWDAGNDYAEAMYYRLAQVVSFSNSFISLAGQLEAEEASSMIAEARFIRAYAYYNLMDLYANVPLVTEISTELPTQSNRAEIFPFIETELKEIIDLLPAARGNEYSRVDRVAAQALLSRMYLNAEVFIGEDRYADALMYAEEVINSGYTLNTTDGNNNGNAYDELFLADNDSNGAQNEFIFVLNYDGIQSQAYSGATFLVKSTASGNWGDLQKLLGVNGAWGGYRTTKSMVEKFDYAITGSDADGFPIAWRDGRANFFTEGHNYEIQTLLNTFEDGYGFIKFRNLKINGEPGNDISGEHADCDVPLIRLAEVYLNYAEAAVKGGGGSLATATGLINELRTRAGAPTITQGDLTPQFVLDERSRELQWEGLRRTDLIRYGQFTSSSYVWPFKGGTQNGTGVEDFRKIFPLPVNVLNINPNLTQNPGY
ncbi:RagB/SusD family nutrient uptake outer membrane protein [Robertkochia sediminum]|uniref:RagB/SusD family nutrient uptake outer membrane protein n=1 Tax=Robertkochia sediminum TaxID=2785326 RepID=UPI001932E063|nr:RagB/SusD family nutrient uptake outer membrane protein [Robertkochia sediminum]MBL7474020.1 RagB/SusD family nutrient uptake outer membrane protein [Robertkochia sediminum]